MDEREAMYCRIMEECIRNEISLDRANIYGNTPLFCATLKGYTSLVRLLLENGADLNLTNKYGMTPLHVAACRDNVEIVRLLLEYGANPSVSDKGGAIPIELANFEIRELMLKYIRKDVIWDLWEMETDTFDSFIQWLPREMIEDSLAL